MNNILCDHIPSCVCLDLSDDSLWSIDWGLDCTVILVNVASMHIANSEWTRTFQIYCPKQKANGTRHSHECEIDLLFTDFPFSIHEEKREWWNKILRFSWNSSSHGRFSPITLLYRWEIGAIQTFLTMRLMVAIAKVLNTAFALFHHGCTATRIHSVENSNSV